MSDVIRWEAPPAHGNTGTSRRGRKPLYQGAADALRDRPGEWAIVAEGIVQGTAGSLAWRIRNGFGPWGPARTFETRSVGSVEGASCKVYARYVGADGAS